MRDLIIDLENRIIFQKWGIIALKLQRLHLSMTRYSEVTVRLQDLSQSFQSSVKKKTQQTFNKDYFVRDIQVMQHLNVSDKIKGIAQHFWK